MPWKKVEAMDERMKCIAKATDDDESFAALCREFGISRNTGYKWVKRFEDGGPGGLAERASVARINGNALSEEQVDAVLALRRERPTWGPKKLRARLLELKTENVPCASTIGEVIKRHGLVRPRRRRPYAPREFTGLTVGEQANDVWCVDFKGDFRLLDKTRCYPLTISDFSSRYLLACSAQASTKEQSAKEVFDHVFR